MSFFKRSLKAPFFLVIFCIILALNGCVTAKMLVYDPPIKLGKSRQLEDTIKPKTYFVDTEDGWHLEILRYRREQSSQDMGPILLLHGFHHNAQFWDVDAEHSFARYLAVRGFDVWSLSFRGTGGSSTEGFVKVKGLFKFFTSNVPAMFDPTSYDKTVKNWYIDDYIDQDLPAVLKFVCHQTGQENISVIGHSLGGVIALGYVAKNPEKSKIKEIIAISSPGFISQPPNDMLADIGQNAALYYSTFLINAKVTGQLGAVFERGVTPFEVLFYNRHNIDKKTLALMFGKTVEDVPLGVLDQMRDMIQTGEFSSKDKRYNYSENFGNVKVPTLFLVGTLDNIASPTSVYLTYKAVGSEDKAYREFSTVNRYTSDYGHNDMVLGKNARSEVFAFIYHWLLRHRPTPVVIDGDVTL